MAHGGCKRKYRNSKNWQLSCGKNDHRSTERIIEKIYGEWIKTPIVDIKILNQEITVLGEVRDPQVIPVDKSHNSLLEMIARCKGFDFYANTAYIKVFRQVGKNVHVANINLTKGAPVSARNINLYPGDVVVVPSKNTRNSTSAYRL